MRPTYLRSSAVARSAGFRAGVTLAAAGCWLMMVGACSGQSPTTPTPTESLTTPARPTQYAAIAPQGIECVPAGTLGIGFVAVPFELTVGPIGPQYAGSVRETVRIAAGCLAKPNISLNVPLVNGSWTDAVQLRPVVPGAVGVCAGSADLADTWSATGADPWSHLSEKRWQYRAAFFGTRAEVSACITVGNRWACSSRSCPEPETESCEGVGATPANLECPAVEYEFAIVRARTYVPATCEPSVSFAFQGLRLGPFYIFKKGTSFSRVDVGPQPSEGEWSGTLIGDQLSLVLRVQFPYSMSEDRFVAKATPAGLNRWILDGESSGKIVQSGADSNGRVSTCTAIWSGERFTGTLAPRASR
jgi:hypothetical protein